MKLKQKTNDSFAVHVHSTLMLHTLQGNPINKASIVLPVPVASLYQSSAEQLETDSDCDGILLSRDNQNQFAYWRLENIRSSYLSLTLKYRLELRNINLDLTGLRVKDAGTHPEHNIYSIQPDAPFRESSQFSQESSLADVLDAAWKYACDNAESKDNCGHYSSRTTMFLNSLGLSTRHGYGTVGIPMKGIRIFRGDDKRRYPTVGLAGSDACPHTWAEVFVSGYGWIGAGGYYPLSIAFAHASQVKPYDFKLIPNHTFGPVYDSGCNFNIDGNMQIEFTTIYSPCDINTKSVKQQSIQNCPFDIGQKMNCAGHEISITCCLLCPFRSTKCAFSNNYDYWQRVCHNCPQVFPKFANSFLDEYFHNIIEELGNSKTQQPAAELLIRRGIIAVSYLIKATNDDNQAIRYWAAYTLSRMDSASVKRALIRTMHPASPWNTEELQQMLESSCDRVPGLANMELLKNLISKNIPVA